MPKSIAPESLASDSLTPGSLAEWLHYLETLHPVGIDMGLERVAEVAKRMGLLNSPIAPQVITVAGTNGKGSTLAMMDAVARTHGLRVGTYTSPHLVRYNERVTINGDHADDQRLMTGFSRVEEARLQTPEISLTYFEAGTLCALWCLAQENLDLALLEVGLGGRLDAVNIIDADVAIVTTIAQDHANFLGSDIAQIGREKAGIFRAAKPAVLGSRLLPSSVAEAANAIAAPVYCLGEAFSHSITDDSAADSLSEWSWSGLSCQGEVISLAGLPDPGLPIDNAATALQALTLSGLVVNADACRRAFHGVQVPGRMQWIGQWCLDVGHNPHAADYVARRLPSVPEGGRQWALIGMLNDKDADGVISALLPRITDWVCVTLEGERGRSAAELAGRITSLGGRVHHCASSPEAGVQIMAEQLAPSDRVLVTGSFFTVAALLEITLPQA
ncbi:bifunctional tetrahydrofolate synthase/dihydrofolate synthase [Halomonas sp. XH26]|uniref:bifunctional tetrahydrofolate synthase/dihydrofolate synthase n=1 Tax=Halomonadaceae TaxID=28256 RepID=UPI000EA312A4|nr:MULTISPECIES: bifunctional tetrahydrofolate synthase/dihydrofolate synthase [Halomonas]AYF35294.1 bifunctional tetrahydrofolate synthase/dihydrofolate synthase [Halomonas alkaliphila]UTA81360.1 bifunctional tetrahydrofolate synthase/dihydrofolate synthase [Halomonas sp. XH26]